jgi:predicted kinase
MQGNREPIAHIVVGFIGAGKTTFARRLEQETGAVRFTKDEWMVRLFGNTPPKDKFAEYDHRMATLATDMALKCLQAGVDVIIDEGFWVKEHRDAIKKRVMEAGAVAKVYYIEASLEVMKARTLARSDNPPADSYVIDEVDFDHYWGFFRPPGEEEEFELIHSS